jgi:hypothetical protein
MSSSGLRLLRPHANRIFGVLFSALVGAIWALGFRDANPLLMLTAFFLSSLAWLLAAGVPFWLEERLSVLATALLNAFAAGLAAVGAIAGTNQAWNSLL